MRNKNTAGTEALRYTVFMPDMDASAQARHDRYVGSQYDLSIVIRHQGVHHMPGGREEPRVCYEIYMHDEHTPAGTLIADSCQLPEYYLDETSLDVDDETITLVMNDGWEFVLDLKPILEKYLVNIEHLPTGEVVLTQHFDDEGNPQERGRWINGSTYAVDGESFILTITAPDGTAYTVDLSDRLSFSYDEGDRLFRIHRRGEDPVSFENGDIVDAGLNDDGTEFSITIKKPGDEARTVTIPVTTVEFEEDADARTYTLTINGEPHIIERGDSVSFANPSSNSYVLTINGQDYPFSTGGGGGGGDEVSFATVDPGHYRLTINGAPNDWETGVQNIEHLGDGIFQATLQDGSTIQWFGEYVPGTLFLQDPVIYLRQDTGSATPPITEQADLTVANAFNSFTAIWNFLTTCIVQGTLTIDATGTFNDPTPGPVNTGGATLVTIRGNNLDPDLLSFNWGRNGGSFQHGFSCGGGVSVKLGDCRVLTNQLSPWSAAFQASGPGTTLRLFGQIKIEATNTALVDHRNACFMTVNGGTIYTSSSPTNGVPSTTVELDFVTGCTIRCVFQAEGIYNWTDTLFDVGDDITMQVGVILAANGSVIEFGEGTNQNYETRFTGEDFIGQAFVIEGGSRLVFTRIDAIATNTHAAVQAYLRATTSTRTLDRASYVMFGSTVRWGTDGIDYS